MKITQRYILALLVSAVVAATTPNAIAQKGGFKGRSKGGSGGFSMRSGVGSGNSQSNFSSKGQSAGVSLGSSSGKSTRFSLSTPKSLSGILQSGQSKTRGAITSGSKKGGGLSGRLGTLSRNGSSVLTFPGSKGQATPSLPGGKGSGTIGGGKGLPSPGKLSGITLPGGTRLPGINLIGNQNSGGSNAGNASPGNANGHNSGNGHKGGLKRAIHHWLNCHDVQKNHCVTHTTWCHQAPRHCHWWYNYCPTIYTNYTHCVPCNWTVIPCYADGVVVTEYRWYLGLSGMMLPGKGLGIESVETGSPAEEIGLAPGMIIVGCNGFALTDNEQMAEAIRTSNGILRLDVKVTEDAEIQTVDVAMRRLVSSSF